MKQANKVAVVDVDQCIVDTATPWINYMNKIFEENISPQFLYSTPYDLTQLYTSVIFGGKWERDAAMSYWKQKDLYDDLEPFTGVVEGLENLKRLGYDIVFASVCKDGHEKSKYNFLKKHFPFMDGCVYTREKFYIKADIFIDDRNNNLNGFSEEVLKIRPATPYDQSEVLRGEVYEMYHWWDLMVILREWDRESAYA